MNGLELISVTTSLAGTPGGMVNYDHLINLDVDTVALNYLPSRTFRIMVQPWTTSAGVTNEHAQAKRISLINSELPH